MIDDIQVIRKYTQNTIWIFACLWYRQYKKTHTIDIIIDEAGGWPLLSPLYEKDMPILFFIHHVGEWEFERFGIIGKLARKLYLWMFRQYRNTETITVSNSTRDDLLSLGFSPEIITILENACDVMPIEQIDFSTKKDSLLFLGRLAPIKRVEDAIRAFALFRSSDPSFAHYTLDIVGSGADTQYLQSLHDLVSELCIEQFVFFRGYIERVDMKEYMRMQKILLVPSKKEGYGLVVVEANSYWIPAIGYDVAWLRDSIYDGQNGYLIPDWEVEKMGEKIREILTDAHLYEIISQKSLDHAKSLPDWDTQSDILETILSHAIGNAHQ
jgi:glycosyltransferase involved in cell wall biosynthesis